MKRILLYAGTTEGRELAEGLDQLGIPCTVCVATEYGREIIERKNWSEAFVLREGRMNAEAMSKLLESDDFIGVVDATHPYAQEVSREILESLKGRDILFWKTQREVSAEQYQNMCYCNDTAEAVSLLKTIPGKILLTTGSKNIKEFAEEPSLRSRLYVRVLPSKESLTLCMEAGVCGEQIIALQGPFGKVLNKALMEQYQISCVVTKDGGKNGGFSEKIEAARELGIPVVCIGRPQSEPGLDKMQIFREILKLYPNRIPRNTIGVVGMGPGGKACLTEEGKQFIEGADLLIGSKRALDTVSSYKKDSAVCAVAYLPDQIWQEIIAYEKQANKNLMGDFRTAVIFTGDIGCFSGGEGFWKYSRLHYPEKPIQGIPGISSVVYFAARLGVSWQKAAIISIHGKEDSVLDTVQHYRDTFLLVGNPKDVNLVEEQCRKYICLHPEADIQITVGYQLSYPEEEILPIEEWEEPLKGSVLLYIKNKRAVARSVSACLPDDAFIRGNVPMTKAEIRQLIIARLGLREDSVFYDVGSGTGSIAVQAGVLSGKMQIFAIEKNPEALSLIEQNALKFGCSNIRIVAGEAPAALETLVAPTHAFIGGSGGNLEEIIRKIRKKNPACKIVISAITLETQQEIIAYRKNAARENLQPIVQLQVSRETALGSYQYMKAENPIWIAEI